MKLTRTWTFNLHEAFGTEKPHLNAHIVRMAVLFEDLRIELLAAISEDMKEIEKASYNFRRSYFIRKSIGTMCEFAECFRLLNELPDFQEFKARFEPEHIERWNAAVSFFEEHEPFLKDVRNDISGHFGHSAALYAVQNLSHLSPGMFQVHADWDQGKGGVCFKFVEDITGVALTRHKEHGESSKTFIERTFKLLSEAFDMAVRTTEVVCSYYLLPRMPKSRS